MSKQKKRNIAILGLCTIVLLMVVGYAAFQTVLNINGTSNIASNWNVKITGVTTKNIIGAASNKEEPTFTDTSVVFKTNLELPGDSIEYEVTITNAGNLNAQVDKIELSGTDNPALKFSSSGIIEGDVINAGSTETLLVKAEYLSSVTSQPNSTTSDLTISLEYSQVAGSGIIPEVTNVDSLKQSVVTTGDGLYEDSTELGRYIYRGAEPNNYITFNGEQWRIVSIENDNTIKIIKEEKITNFITYDDSYNRKVEGYCNSPSGCNLWGNNKTMFDNSGNIINGLPIEVNGAKYDLPSENSTLNKYLNVTYYKTVGEEAKGQISDHLFNTGLLKFDNLLFSDDLLQEKAIQWNGNIGLIQATDYVKASMDSGCTSVYQSYNDKDYPCKNSNYLYKSEYHWWTMSPYFGSYTYFVWAVFKDGSLSRISSNGNIGVRPALYLKSDINISGKGTILNPYTIS